MTSHELARLLLEHPDLPVATHANGHTYSSVQNRFSHGPLQIASDAEGHIVIGNMLAYGCGGKSRQILFDERRTDPPPKAQDS